MNTVRKALSNFIALIIVTTILAAASISLMYTLNKQISLLSPTIRPTLITKCVRILNTTYYICNIKSNMRFCGNVEIVMDNGSMVLKICVNPSNSYVFVVNSTPIAVKVGEEMYPISRW